MNDAEAPTHPANEPGDYGLVEYHDFVSDEPFTFERGGRLDEGITVRYETYGHLNREKTNGILICHALSGDHHCAGVHDINDRKPGWWDNMIGPGKPIDTNRFYVICSNCLGGCQGSTGPVSINPETGQQYATDFPALTIRDIVAAQKRLIDHLGIERLYCVTGGSMGGMQALQWAINYPERVARLLPMACTARESAQAIAFNEVGRSAILRDPKWQGGHYDPGDGPDVGLAIARMMAHITYLSDVGLEEKFGRSRQNDRPSKELFDIEFEIESYLRYQGQSFVSRFDANSYLYLTKALDRFDLYGPNGLEETLAPLTARTLVVGFTSDWLYPPAQNRNIVHALLRQRKDATYAEVAMHLGHDSFLVNAPDLYALVQAFLAK